jgi:hypothetical protein
VIFEAAVKYIMFMPWANTSLKFGDWHNLKSVPTAGQYYFGSLTNTLSIMPL